ncbi:MAG TPA: hypothetical protein VL175_07400 [Pirellulales bacterium]|nr:hypothetical protein [Pirellulales bacterium]
MPNRNLGVLEMDVDFSLSLLARWAHILAAIVAVGGTVFARFVATPALNEFSPETKLAVHAAMRRRWSAIVAGSIAFLLVSGLYNVGVLSIRYHLPRWYMPLFAVKFLLAFAIFTLASLLSGKTAAAEALRRNAPRWMNLNIAMAVAVVCISGVLRTAERTPKFPPEGSQNVLSASQNPIAQ